MEMGYELLENDLTDSTLWMYRSDPARILAITIISKCNGSDRVYVPPAILIQRARLTPEQGAAALVELTSPDPNSRCSLEDGRFVVQKMDEDGNRYLWIPSYKGRRRKYLARERKREQRAREEEERSRSVTPRHDGSRVDQIRTEQKRAQKMRFLRKNPKSLRERDPKPRKPIGRFTKTPSADVSGNRHELVQAQVRPRPVGLKSISCLSRHIGL